MCNKSRKDGDVEQMMKMKMSLKGRATYWTRRNMSSTAEEPQVGYVFKISWFESPRHTRSWSDVYFAQAEHTRWGLGPYGYPHCRISYA